MTKQEFINELRLKLSDLDDASYLNETISYYENYIETEVRKGATEEDVIASIGDPRLIAKSIILSREAMGKTSGGKSESDSSKDMGADGYRPKGSFLFNVLSALSKLPGWAIAAIVGGIMLLLLVLFVQLAPFLILFFVIYYFVKFVINSWNN